MKGSLRALILLQSLKSLAWLRRSAFHFFGWSLLILILILILISFVHPGDERQRVLINLQLFVVKERIHQIRIKRKIKIRNLGRVTQKSEMCLAPKVKLGTWNPE